VDRESIVFLDTETTGLSGGTGTYVFMVGLAYFRDDRLLVRQFFMRDHAEEPAMLAALAQELGRHEAVVTFNGKSFDVPLLMTRYTANRQRPSMPTEIHLDLLHPSRRFWKEQLESCTLGTLERAVLGHERSHDIPSWMIPELYFRYLRGDDPRMMVAVFEHNFHDVLSLVALACRLGRLLDCPPDEVSTTRGASVFELFGAARIYEDLGLLEEACARYEQALLIRRDVAVRARVARRLAALCKRAGNHERAIQLWRRLASLGLTGCEPFVELAKHFEHRARDYDAAIQAVEEALTVVEVQVLRRRPGADADRAALEHRLARLMAKRSRAAG
jgi:tetratricopeptide (TPR) repeat protein